MAKEFSVIIEQDTEGYMSGRSGLRVVIARRNLLTADGEVAAGRRTVSGGPTAESVERLDFIAFRDHRRVTRLPTDYRPRSH